MTHNHSSFPIRNAVSVLLLGLFWAVLTAPTVVAEVVSTPTPTVGPQRDGIVTAPVVTSALRTEPTATVQTTREYMLLQPYKPLYAIVAYDRTLGRGDTSERKWEVQFQLSFQVQIMRIPWTSGRLAFGYTQVSFWQIFNGSDSAPFRETDYAPELMAAFDYDPSFLGLTKIRTKYAVIHQSNGKGVQDSRSWNRLYGELYFDWGRFSVGLKPWYRIPESRKSNPYDTRGDDNPDITRYMGYGELSAEYRADWWSLQVTVRNNLRSSPNYGAYQVDLDIPIKNDFKLYVQYFDGYGLSLIDYNRHSRRVGFGVLIEKLPRLW